ncbi:helix-turn-helix domain-containing protein [Streptomyces sp. NPDC054956]
MTQSVTELGLPTPKERRRLREAAELTPEEVAAAVGVTPTTVRSWETGRTDPRGRKREAYAKLLTRLATTTAAPSTEPRRDRATPPTAAPGPVSDTASPTRPEHPGRSAGSATSAPEPTADAAPASGSRPSRDRQADAESATSATGPATDTASAPSDSPLGRDSALAAPASEAAVTDGDELGLAGADTETDAESAEAAGANESRFGLRMRGLVRPVGAQTRPKAAVKRAAKPPVGVPRHEAKTTVKAGTGGGLATLRPGTPMPPSTGAGRGPGQVPSASSGTSTGSGSGTSAGPGSDSGRGTGTGTSPGTDPGPTTATGTSPGTGPGAGPGTGTATRPGTTPDAAAGPDTASGPAANPNAPAGPGTATGSGTSPDSAAGPDTATGLATNPDATAGSGKATASGASPDTVSGPGTATAPDSGSGAEAAPGTGPATAESPDAQAGPDAQADAGGKAGAEAAVGPGEAGEGDAAPGTGARNAPQGTPQGLAVAAFDALYARTAPALARQAYLLTGRRALAQEAVERAFHQAWDRWPEVATDPDPVGWVRAATYEYALSPWHQFRRAHRHPDKPPADPADRILLDAMLALPPAHRRTVLLYDGVGLDLPDTAAETEASTPTAGNRLLNAHADLADRLPELADVAPEKQSALLRERLGSLRPAVRLEPRAAAVVRAAGEHRTRLWTRAALGLTAVIAAATAYTAVTAPTEYEPPRAPGANVSGVPPLSGPQQLSDEGRQLHDKLASDPGAGPARVSPKPE